jgi:hypothetical protein
MQKATDKEDFKRLTRGKLKKDDEKENPNKK